jgi:hypothetical protein
VTTLEIERKNGVALGLCEDTLVIYYAQAPTLESVRTINDATKHPAVVRLNRALALIVIDAVSRAPEAEVRAAMQRSIQVQEARTLALAYAILGTGFSNAAARAVVSGMLLFARPKYPTKVFPTVSAASHWLLSQGDKMSVPDSHKRLDRAEQLEWLRDFCCPIGAGNGQRGYI